MFLVEYELEFENNVGQMGYFQFYFTSSWCFYFLLRNYISCNRQEAENSVKVESFCKCQSHLLLDQRILKLQLHLVKISKFAHYLLIS